MTTATQKEFGKWRFLFWPIHRSELRKFLPMFFIYSLIVFNYSILRAAKDALIITAPESGAAAIPYIKIWAILPMAFLSTLIFTRLSNRFSREKVFYFLMSSFLIFFLLFGFVLYPLQDVLHPHKFADFLQSHSPKGLQGLIAIFRNWTFSLFYVMSELWSTIIMTVLFWGFANEVTSVKEAKRFYAIFGVGANLATIVAGQVGILLSSKLLYTKMHLGGDRWGQSLMMISALVVTIGLVILALYRWLSAHVFEKETYKSSGLKEEKEQIKMGIRKNFAYLAKSKYLICIAVIVLTYNISLNMIEIVWKDQVHHLCPYAADYNIYMSKVLTYIGITSTLFGLFICGQVLRRFSWTTGAYITPTIVLITSFLFFAFLLFKEVGFVGSVASFLGFSPLALCAFFGSVQNCLARASKFTFFDVTKEIAFIPLNNESKLKGKAAIDGVGSRLGKSGGAVVHQFLLLIFGGVSMSAPYVAVIIFIVAGAWVIAVKSLGKQFHELSEQKQMEEAFENEPSYTEKKPTFASNNLEAEPVR